MFFDKDEMKLIADFEAHGYVIREIINQDEYEMIRSRVSSIITKKLSLRPSETLNFDLLHKLISIDRLNDLRIALIDELNDSSWFRPAYYKIAKQCLDVLVGSEIAMQRRVGLSLQLPEDQSSLLPIHCDVWSGDSPFEIVAWVPLTDCYGSKSMFILPSEEYWRVEDYFDGYRSQHADLDLFKSLERNLVWLNVSPGQILLFNQALPHGNIVNQTDETRVSFNCRFKGIFTPYSDKKLGEFFEPVRMTPMSREGLRYKKPRVK